MTLSPTAILEHTAKKSRRMECKTVIERQTDTHTTMCCRNAVNRRHKSEADSPPARGGTACAVAPLPPAGASGRVQILRARNCWTACNGHRRLLCQAAARLFFLLV